MTPLQHSDERLQQVRSACQRITLEAMHSVRMKYSDDRYVHRPKSEGTFDRFLKSDKSLFLVLGDSGTGKTNLICWLANKVITDCPTLFTIGLWRTESTVSLMDVIFQRLKADLKWNTPDTWQFVRELDGTLDASKLNLIILVDGINETNDPEWVLDGFRDVLKRCPITIRFVLSCRTDSFQLHFKHSYWAEYVYREDWEKTKDAAEGLEAELEALSKSVHENINIMSTAQNFLIELAIKKHKMEVRKARLQRMQTVSNIASVLLETFTDAELAEAMERYGTTANLVGDALEDCHDPLVFRLFADTVGRSDVEVSDVFTLSNAERYLGTHVSEAAPPEASQRVYSLLFRLARYSSSSMAGEVNSLKPLALSPDDTLIAEKLVETGLLVWKPGPANGSPNFVFSFDRVLSFVLALDVAAGGATAIIGRLSQTVRSADPQVIYLNEARYLLLFLDRLEASSGNSCPQWALTLSRAKGLRAQILTLLPELRCMPAQSSLEIIDQQLWFSYRIKYDTEDDIAQVEACAEALATLCRKGYSDHVLDRLEVLLRKPELPPCLEPLARPLAACFEQHQERCGHLLELLCGGFDEVVDLEESRYQMSSRLRYRRTLRKEIERFPSARFKLIEWLAESHWGIFRSIAAAGLPGLWFSRPEAAKKILRELENDPDDRVRSSLSEIILPIAKLNIDTAVNLCTLLGEDPESAVRMRFVTMAVTLISLGHTQLHQVIQNAVGDKSPKVRAALTGAAVNCMAAPESSPGVHQLMKALLTILADDRSNIVRTKLISGSQRYAALHPEFAIKLLLDVTRDAAPKFLRANVITALAAISIDWGKYSADAELIAIKFGKDPDYGVREASIPFLSKAADGGCTKAREVLTQLAEDPELALREQLLKTNAERPSPSLVTAIAQANVVAPFTGLDYRGALAKWILGVTDTKLAALTWKESLDRFRRNVGLLGILVSLSTIAASALVHSFGGSGTVTLDWRSSEFPLLMGMCLALVIAVTQRWLDIHYYTGAVSCLHRRILLSVSFPLFFGLLFFVTISLVTKSSEWLLAATSIILSVICGWAAASLYREPFDQISLIILTGYYCGLFASTLVGATNNSYFGLFFIICPLLLNLRANWSFAAFVGTVVGVGIWATAGALLLQYFVLWKALNHLKWGQWALQLSSAAYGATIFALIASASFALFGVVFAWLRRSWFAAISATLLWVCTVAIAVRFHGWSWNTLVIAGLSAIGINFIFVIPVRPELFWPTLLVAMSAYGFAYEGTTQRFWMVSALALPIVAVLVLADKLIRGPKRERGRRAVPEEEIEKQYKTMSIWSMAALIGFVLVPFIYVCSAALRYALSHQVVFASVHSGFLWSASAGVVSFVVFLEFAAPRVGLRHSYRWVVPALFFTIASAIALFLTPSPAPLISLAIGGLTVISISVITLRNNPALRLELVIFVLAPQLTLLVTGATGSLCLGMAITFLAMALVLRFGLIHELILVHRPARRRMSEEMYPRSV